MSSLKKFPFGVTLPKCDSLWFILKQGPAHNPALHSGYLSCGLIFLFLVEHTCHQNLFPSKGLCWLCCVSCVCDLLMEGVCLTHLVVLDSFTLCPFHIVSLTSDASLHCQCDRFEPQEV